MMQQYVREPDPRIKGLNVSENKKMCKFRMRYAEKRERREKHVLEHRKKEEKAHNVPINKQTPLRKYGELKKNCFTTESEL